MQKKTHFLVALALGAVALSALGALGVDIWLASTQWLLTAAVLNSFAIYLRLSE